MIPSNLKRLLFLESALRIKSRFVPLVFIEDGESDEDAENRAKMEHPQATDYLFIKFID